jgi:hypothetical protein
VQTNSGKPREERMFLSSEQDDAHSFPPAIILSPLNPSRPPLGSLDSQDLRMWTMENRARYGRSRIAQAFLRWAT